MEGATVREGSVMMRLLEARVPLTLLVDLASPPDPLQLYVDDHRSADYHMVRDVLPAR